MSLALIINVAVFISLLAGLYQFNKKNCSLSTKVFLGLVLGVVFGAILHLIYGVDNHILWQSLAWFNVVGNGYVGLLQMVIMPLVFISILSAVAKLHDVSSLGKISFYTIGILLGTTLIAAIVGVLMVKLFGLSAQGLVQGANETARLGYITANQATKLSSISIQDIILSFIPVNPFADLANARATSIIAIVIFSTFLGVAAIQLLHHKPEQGKKLLSAIEILQIWILQLVRIIIRLTPYGVFALMTKVVASSDIAAILNLATFIIASYLGLAIMFAVHGGLLTLFGINPFKFFKKVSPVLVFAFTSRSSAASIPLNIEAQTARLGVPQSIASFAASFGATIGQNGCAGLYPAMLAAMVAPTMGINPLDPMWFMTLVVIVTISSLGVAGVGGGATFAALIVLPMMGLPVTLVALLISIEPLIDMGRTALNVNGSMTAGSITSQIMHTTDKSIFDNDRDVALKHS